MSDLPKNDPRLKYKAMAQRLAEDVDALTNEELIKEACEDGLNAAEIARDMRSSAMDIVQKAKRNLLAQTRARMEQTRQGAPKKAASRPSLDVIKARLNELFSHNPNLAVAFRGGKSQSDSDWISLWENLIELGEIKDKNGDN